MPRSRLSSPGDPAHHSFNGHVPLLTSRFQYAHRRTLFGRARLFADYIELAHWDLHGGHRRRLPLTHVAAVEYHPLTDGANLTIMLDSGEDLHLDIEQAHRWREVFEHWLAYAVLPSAKLTSGLDEASALAG